MKHHEPLPRYINDLWVNWAVSCVALAAPLVLSAFLSKIWLPIAMLVVLMVLSMYVRSASARTHPSCLVVIRLTQQVLAASVVVMLVVNIVYNNQFVNLQTNLTGYNPKSPFITAIVITPLMFLFALVALLRRGRGGTAVEPNWQFRYSTNDEVIDQILRSEVRFQLRTYTVMGFVLAVAAWVYYLVFFINVNINHPDILFFWVIPAGALGASVFYMTSRTYYVAFSYRRAEMDPRHRNSYTSLRYLIVKEDRIYLDDETEALSQGHKVDTPASIDVQRCRQLPEKDVERYFSDLTGLKDVSIRYLYSSGHRDLDNILHYAAFLGEGQNIDEHRLEGRWYTFHGLQRLLNAHMVTLSLAAEITRIYTITMVWKTYDREGRRLYPIRDYKPSFRLKDFPSWDVDYEDNNWLRVAANNEDRFLYRLRRLWRRQRRNA